MKRMTILLSAAALALVPLVSNAKGGPKERPTTPEELQISDEDVTCSCSVSGDATEEDGVWVTPITCTNTQWPDVVGKLVDDDPTDDVGPYDLATYGASFDVDLLDEATEGAQVDTLMAELEPEGNWSGLCNGDTCDVLETTFHLTNFDGTQQIRVYAAVKAFYNGKDGDKPRNFEKARSAVACYTNVSTDLGE